MVRCTITLLTHKRINDWIVSLGEYHTFFYLGNYIYVDTDFIFMTIKVNLDVNVRFLLKIARFTL